MSIFSIFAIAAGIISLLGYAYYIVSILQGKTKPNKASWTVWGLVGGILLFTYFETGDINTIWLPVSLFIGPLLIMLLSFKYGYAQWTKLDKMCLFFAILTIIPWVFLHAAKLTLVLNVIIDGIGAIPTVVKCYQHPETEDRKVWAVIFFGSLLEMFAMQEWSIAVIYPLYLLIANTLILSILLTRGFYLGKTRRMGTVD